MKIKFKDGTVFPRFRVVLVWNLNAPTSIYVRMSALHVSHLFDSWAVVVLHGVINHAYPVGCIMANALEIKNAVNCKPCPADSGGMME